MTEARDGREGLDRVAEARPDLIVLDLMMPEVDGFGFAEELSRHESWRTIPILVVTAKDLSDRERRLLHGHAFRVLEKGSASRRELQDLIRLEVGAARPPARHRVDRRRGLGADRPRCEPPDETDAHAQDPAGRR